MSATSSVAKLHVKREESKTGISLTQLALRRLRRDKLTLLALGIVLLMALLAILARPISDALGVSFQRTDPNATFLPPFSPGHEGG